MKTQTLMLACAFMLLVGMQFAAAYDFDQPLSDEDQEQLDQMATPVMKIYNMIKYGATIFAGIAMLIAGIFYMTSGSDPKKRDNAKTTAMYTIIGLVVIWAAPLVVNFIN